MLQGQSLELDIFVIVINIVICGLSGEDLKWLAHVLSYCTCLITANCPNALSEYNFVRLIEQNTAVSR